MPADITRLTMVPRSVLVTLAGQVDDLLAAGVEGDLVECGVWRGGASFVMADRLRRAGADGRAVWMFDSYEGMPPPQPIDGERAFEWANDADGDFYFDNCTANLTDVQAAAEKLGLTPRVRMVKGWFDDTLPSHRDRIGPIALLRIDADWYDSVLCCLENLYDLVSPGGLVVLDDYYTWDGCTQAVHDFLSRRHLAHRIEQSGCAFFRKG
jgi:O-methyltransferase